MATINVLIVGGGGGGGKGSVINRGAGGGGAGGFISTSTAFSAGQLTVVVGAGGAAGATGSVAATNGGNSSVTGLTTAVGGGGGTGGDGGGSGSAGGSGGGAGDNGGSAGSGGSGTGGQGSAGGANSTSGGSGGSGGGGGGSSAIGGVGVLTSGVRAAGGAGTASSISGASVTYAAGGSGGEYLNGADGTAGGTNTGNGGGGGTGNKGSAGVAGLGAAGGSGIVIISYVTGALVGVLGGTITTSGGNTIHTFTSSGTFGFPSPPVVGLNFDFPLPRRYGPRSGYRPQMDFMLGVNLPLKFPYVPPTPSATIVVTINGLVKTTNIDLASIEIQDNLNEQPNTCNMRLHGYQPTVGLEVKVGLGSIDPTVLIFAGVIISVKQVYDDAPRSTGNIAWEVTCTDYVFLLNRRRPTGQFIGQPADEVARSLFSSFSSGFNTAGIPNGLPEITISFDGSGSFAQCLTDVCNAVGYHWKVGYAKDVQMFLTASGTDPTAIDASNTTTQNKPQLTYDIDLSQIRTRVTGRGAASQLQSNVDVGETKLPLQAVDSFNPSGGSGYMGSVPIAYTGVILSSGGSFVGPGASPSSPPVAIPLVGAGLSQGAYQYAYTDVTGSGESLPSPVASVTTFTLPTPSAPTVDTSFPGFGNHASYFNTGDTVNYRLTFSGAVLQSDLTNESASSSATTYIAAAGPAGAGASPQISITQSTDPNVRWCRLWRSVNGSSYYLLYSFAPPSNGPIQEDIANGTVQPASNATSTQVRLTAIAVGASSVTARKLYRTAVGGSQLKLVTTIANNVATTYDDALADGSLGANVPTSDTSGLVSGAGTISAGATSIIVSSLATFNSAGGWAQVGGMVIRFSGQSSSALTGIPATGNGSIVAPINYGQTITPLPCITGVTGGVVSTKGTPVGILITVNDLAAQVAVAALEGGDGIHEFQFSDTSILTELELTQNCDAQLQLFNTPLITVVESARDINTKSGQTLTVTLPAPMSITASLLIQTVTITNIGTEVGAFPLYTATASSVKFTLQDFLRQLGALIHATPGV